MFEDSLVESAGKIKTKKGSTVIVSAIVHVCLVLVLIIVPLIFTEQIEGAKLTSFLVAPPPPPAAAPPPPPAAAIAKPVAVKVVQIDPTALVAPTEVPKNIEIIHDAAPETNSAPCVGCVTGGKGSAGNGPTNGINPFGAP